MLTSVAQSGFTIASGGAGLNTTQSENLQALLSNYDAKNISTTDAEQIVSGVRELGVKAGKGLADAFAQAGFDAKEISDKAGVERSAKGERPPPPPDGSGLDIRNLGLDSETSDAVTALSVLLENYDSEAVSNEGWANLYEALGTSTDSDAPYIDILI